MAENNGTIAKLTNLRHSFLVTVEEARSQFVSRIKEAREYYISQVVDVTLTDPQLSDVERALAGATPTVTPAALIPKPESNPTLVPIGQSGDSSKFPLKRLKGVGVYGRCGNCNVAILEAQAKFCSKCAYPLGV